MVGLHSQMDPFSSGSGSGGLGRTLPDATGTRERTTQAAGQSFKRQHAAMPPQGKKGATGRKQGLVSTQFEMTSDEPESGR